MGRPDRATAVVAALLHADRIISDSIEKGLRAQAGLSLAHAGSCQTRDGSTSMT